MSRGFVFDRYEALGRYVDGWMDGWWRYNTRDELFERGSNLQENCDIHGVVELVQPGAASL